MIEILKVFVAASATTLITFAAIGSIMEWDEGGKERVFLPVIALAIWLTSFVIFVKIAIDFIK